MRGYARKGYGAARIRQELTRRGIDRDTAEAAMQTVLSRMRRKCWLCSKNACAVTFPTEKRSKKPLRHSERRGFAWNDIKRALETYGNSLPEEE